MAEPWRSMHAGGASGAKLRVRGLADRQFGRVRRDQLSRLGIDRGQIAHWRRESYLGLVLPTVFAVGHCAPSVEADLAATLLYAGPGAMLSHATAAWWLGLIDHRPVGIDLSTPRRCKSVPGVRVHDRRPDARIWHRNLPITPIAQTALDLASVFEEDPLRSSAAPGVSRAQPLLAVGRRRFSLTSTCGGCETA